MKKFKVDSKMDSAFVYGIVTVLLQFLIFVTEGIHLPNDLPSPWIDPAACGVNDSYYQESNRRTTICDPDGTLPPLERMVTGDALHTCQEESMDNTTFVLLLSGSITGRNAAQKNFSKAELLKEKAVTSYNLTQESSVIFLLVTNNSPLQTGMWLSNSLSYAVPQTTREEALRNMTSVFQRNKHFPSAVNELVRSFCQAVRVPPYEPAIWDGLTIFSMIFVILVIAAITGGTIHLIMVRYKAFHKGGRRHNEELRAIPGRPNLSPLSMEMQELGPGSVYQPSGNLLLSSSDVTAVVQHSSTANLLET